MNNKGYIAIPFILIGAFAIFGGIIAGNEIINSKINNTIQSSLATVQPDKCLLRWNKEHTEVSCFRLGNGELLGTATKSGNFPTSTNSFQDGDVINAGDWNAIEQWIGIRTATDTDSLSYKLISTSTLNPGHKHSSSSISGVLPLSVGGTGTSTTYASGSIIYSNGTLLTQNSSALYWDNGNTRLGIGTSSPIGNLHVIYGTATSGVAVGSIKSGVNRGLLCLWNGENYTITQFAAGSTTPIYSTSTTCQ